MTLNRALTGLLAFDAVVLAFVLVAGLVEKRADPAGEGLKMAYTVFIALPFVIGAVLALVPAAPARWAALAVASTLPLALLYHLFRPVWAPIAERRTATGAAEFPSSPARRVAAAIAAGDEGALRRLVAETNPDLDAEGRENRSLLMLAVERNPALIPPLVALGADPNRRTSIGELPLEVALSAPVPGAVKVGQLDGARLLLEAGANVNEKTRFDQWLLEYAVRNRRPDQAALLLAHGADPTVHGELEAIEAFRAIARAKAVELPAPSPAVGKP